MRPPRYGTPRIHVSAAFSSGAQLDLPEAQSHHAARVLRLREGEELVLFDGRGGEWRARIAAIGKRSVRVALGEHVDIEREAPIALTLVQALSSAERMDYTVQKAVELGVASIETVVAEKSVTRLAGARAEARAAHWRRIAIAACEQSGRNRIPAVAAPVGFEAWRRTPRKEALRLLAAPGARTPLREALAARPASLAVAVGPEAGFSAAEESSLAAAGFAPVHLGPRILRTETVAPALFAAINALAGDWT